MTTERIKEILWNAINWAGEHNEEFWECFVDALEITEEEADELGIELSCED